MGYYMLKMMEKKSFIVGSGWTVLIDFNIKMYVMAMIHVKIEIEK